MRAADFLTSAKENQGMTQKKIALIQNGKTKKLIKEFGEQALTKGFSFCSQKRRRSL